MAKALGRLTLLIAFVLTALGLLACGEKETSDRRLELALLELDAAGWRLEDPESAKSLERVLRLVGERADAGAERALDRLGQHGRAEDLAAFEELASLQELGAFDLFSRYELEIVDFLPDGDEPTGSLSDPLGILGGEGEEESAKSCYLCPDFPSSESFAGYTWRQGLTPGDDPARYDSREDSPLGTSSVTYTERDKDGNVTADGVVTFRDDGSLESRMEYHDDGSGTMRTIERDSNGEVIDEFETPVPDAPRPESAPPKDPAPKPDPKAKIAGYRPGDDAGHGVCPLVLDYCRRVAEAFDDPEVNRYRLVRGMVLVNPPREEDLPSGPRLEVDRDGLVINPDPDNIPSRQVSGPVSFRFAMPVLVLPPRPGSGPE